MYMSECVIGGGSQTLDIVSLSIRVSARNHYEPKRVILIASNRFKADFFVFLRVYQKFALQLLEITEQIPSSYLFTSLASIVL